MPSFAPTSGVCWARPFVRELSATAHFQTDWGPDRHRALRELPGGAPAW
jgi:hypothetical protein